MKFLIILLAIFLSGCAVSASKNGDTLLLRGWGAKRAVWPDGSSIEKEEPIHVPNILPSK